MNAGMTSEIRDLFGVLIIDNALFVATINMNIEKVVVAIRERFDVEKIHSETMAIMNCWRRTKSWLDEDYVSKFDRCLEEVVVDEMRGFLKGFLETRREELGTKALKDSDFFDGLESARVFVV